MVRCHTVVDLAGSNVLLDLLVQFEVVFARQDFDLGTGFLFPFRDDGVQRFILCATDQLYFQRITFELFRLNTPAPHSHHPPTPPPPPLHHPPPPPSHPTTLSLFLFFFFFLLFFFFFFLFFFF